MPNARLTKEFVSRIKPAGAVDVFYWDTKTPGFGLRVRAESMTYYAQGRIPDVDGWRTVRMKIGSHPTLTPDQAEKQAKILLARLEMGENPNARAKAARARTVTLQQLFQEYIRVKKLRPKTLSVYESALRRCFPDWLDKPCCRITKDMVQKRHIGVRPVDPVIPICSPAWFA